MGKAIEIQKEDFDKLVGRIDYYKDKIRDLEKTIAFLNTQIDEYNLEFVGKVDEK